MKKAISFLTMLIVTIIYCNQVTYAQQSGKLNPEQRAKIKAQVKEDIAKLKLSENQKQPYKAVTIKYFQQLSSLKNSGSSRWSKYRKFKSIIKAKNAEVKTILSKSQYSTYLATQERRIEAMKRNR